MIYNELKRHGTEDFPFGLYRVDVSHPQYEMTFHWHTSLELIRVLSGELHLSLDNRQFCLTAGEVGFVNSETVHGATPKDCIYECLVFDLAFLKTGNAACDGFIDNLLARNDFLQEKPTDSEIVRLTHRVFEEVGRFGELAPFKAIGLLHQLLGEIQEKRAFTAYMPPSSVQDKKKIVKLKIALNYVQENYSKNITLDDMAAVAGLSCKYFCKFFKDETGMTPVHYLMAYRIERAARQLLASDLSVTQIAYDCGFNDLSYFTKTFKAFKNATPKQYRNR